MRIAVIENEFGEIGIDDKLVGQTTVDHTRKKERRTGVITVVVPHH